MIIDVPTSPHTLADLAISAIVAMQNLKQLPLRWTLTCQRNGVTCSCNCLAGTNQLQAGYGYYGVVDARSSNTSPLLSRKFASSSTKSLFAPAISVKSVHGYKPRRLFSSKSNLLPFSDDVQSYKKAIDSILSSKKFLSMINALQTQLIWDKDMLHLFRSWLLMKEPVIANSGETRRRWCRIKKAWNQNLLDKHAMRSMLMLELKCQRDMFTHDITSINNLPEKLPKTFFSVSQQVFRQLAEQCENKSQPSIIFIAWEKIKESGMVLNTSTLNALLKVSSKVVKTSQDLDFAAAGSLEEGMDIAALEDIILYHDILCGPTDVEEALAAEVRVKTFKNTTKYQRNSREMTYLQIYSLILKHHCVVSNNVSSALSLLRKMSSLPGVVLDHRVYVMVISKIAELGYFREDSEPIEGAIDNGYKYACGAKLFDELNKELANVAVAITEESAAQLQNAICKGFKGTPIYRNKPVSQSDTSEQFPTKHDEVVATRVRLDSSTWYCPVTRTQQHIGSLSLDQKKIFYNDILASVKDSHGQVERRLKEFAEWLENRKGRSFSVIVDGANVGKILPVVEKLEEMGEYPLVIVPAKHAVHRKDLTRLEKYGQLAVVPDKLDDIYCILASVTNQTVSSQGKSIHVESTLNDTRWPGARPVLLTNDILRDHTLLLRDPLLGREWYNCHVVNTAKPPSGKKYSLRFHQQVIQGNTCTVTSKKEYVWHYPVVGWGHNERLVVRLPTCNKSK